MSDTRDFYIDRQYVNRQDNPRGFHLLDKRLKWYNGRSQFLTDTIVVYCVTKHDEPVYLCTSFLGSYALRTNFYKRDWLRVDLKSGTLTGQCLSDVSLAPSHDYKPRRQTKPFMSIAQGKTIMSDIINDVSDEQWEKDMEGLK